MSYPLQSDKPLNAPGDDVLKAQSTAMDRGDDEVVVVPLRNSPTPVLIAPTSLSGTSTSGQGFTPTTVMTPMTTTVPVVVPTAPAASNITTTPATVYTPSTAELYMPDTTTTSAPVLTPAPTSVPVVSQSEADAGDVGDVTVTTTTTDDLDIHGKSMTEKMKGLVVDNARLAKDKAMDALHVAYEKIHDAGIAVEERAAQVLKHLGHAQMNKAEELEHDATRRRQEIDSQPPGPGILDKASLKLREAGVALEAKTGQLLQGTGQTLQETAAPKLEQDAAQRRLEAEGKPTILDKASLNLREAGAAIEAKTGQLLQGTGQSMQESAPKLEQDATQRRIEAEGKPSMLDKASLNLREAGAAIEAKTGQLLHGTGQSMQESAAPKLEQDATQRRVEAEGKPSMLDTAKTKLQEATATVEEKAGKMLQGSGQTIQESAAPKLEQDASERREEAATQPKGPSLVEKAKAKLKEAGAAIEEKASEILPDTSSTQESGLGKDVGSRRAPDASWYDTPHRNTGSQISDVDTAIGQPLPSQSVVKEVPVVQAIPVQAIPVQTMPVEPAAAPAPAFGTTTTTFPISKTVPPSTTTTTSGISPTTQHVPFWDASPSKRRTPSPYHTHAMDEPSGAGGPAGSSSATSSQGAFDAFKKVSANIEEKAHRAIKGLSDMSYSRDIGQGTEGSSSQFPSSTLASSSSDPLPKSTAPPTERKVIPDPVD